MSSTVGYKKDDVNNLSSRRFLNEIENVSRGLHISKKSINDVALPHSHHRSKSFNKSQFVGSRLNVGNEDLLPKDKKSSIWKKSLQALAHIRNRRFNCWFFLHVHSIEGLPLNFNNTNVCVHWKRKQEVMQTHPVRVSQGRAEFEETLMNQCSVYGSKNGHHHSAKYEPKVFLLYASVVEATAIDMGKHWIDVTKLLPLTLEELEDRKSSGKWGTSFKLGGKAKGGVLNVSFGFSVRRNNLLEVRNSTIIPKLMREKNLNVTDNDEEVVRDSGGCRLRRVGSAPSNSRRYLLIQSQSLDGKLVDEVIANCRSELPRSICFVYEKVDEAKSSSSHDSFCRHGETLEKVTSFCIESSCENVERDSDDTSFTITEQGTELSKDAPFSFEGAARTSEIETIDVREIFKDDEIDGDGKLCNLRDADYCNNKDHPVIGDSKEEGNDVGTEKLIFKRTGAINVKKNSKDDVGVFGCVKFISTDGYDCNSDNQYVIEDTTDGGNDTSTNVLVIDPNDKEIIDVKEISEDDEIAVYGCVGLNSIDDDYHNNEDHHVIRDTISHGNDVHGKESMFEKPDHETCDTNEILKNDELDVNGEIGCDPKNGNYHNDEDYHWIGVTKNEGNDASTEGLLIGKTDSFNCNPSVSEFRDPDYLLDIDEFGNEIYANSKPGKIARSLSLDDITNSVAEDFLRGLDLGADSDPESPRELLLRQFEEEALASGGLILNFDSEDENVGYGGDSFCLPLVIHVDDKDEDVDSNRSGLSLRIKKDAELLEYLETEALMKEWGFNEHVFENSPRSRSGGFGSPIYIPAEEPVEFPPLGEGLGSTVKTQDGGFLRSMNPLLFKKAKNGAKLIMQVSAPFVLPLAMGSTVMEILEHWASVGYEKMYKQVDELMPLDDISGKVLKQVAWEIASRLEAERLPYLERELNDRHSSISSERNVKETPFSWNCNDSTSTLLCEDLEMDYVSFEGLSPLVMDKIETLLMAGLRIQSGMADEEAPSIIKPQQFGKTSAFMDTRVMAYGSPVSEGVDKSEAKDHGDDLDELISLSLKLDDWMRLDAGIFGQEDGIGERTSKIIEAHLTKNMEFNSTGKNCGLLGNNFTVGLRVQLRDPLRDYETVGEPMLSLVEVERVFVDQKPIIQSRVSEGINNEENDDFSNQVIEETNAEDKQKTPMFKISEVHVVGFSIESFRKQNQGTKSQDHSGSRWLLASGMGEMKKLIHFKTNAIVRSFSQGKRKTLPRDTLWSISSHVHSPGAKWKELATMNIHIRNPDVMFLS